MTHIADFRARRRALPLEPYGALDFHPRYGVDRTVLNARSVLDTGWIAGKDRLPSVAPPIPWDQGHRSLAMHVQSFAPLTNILLAHRFTGERLFFEAALAFALDWVEHHPHFERRKRDKGTKEDSFAWYDMAAAMRAYRLAYLLDVAARDEAVEAPVVRKLFEAMAENCRALATEEIFARHNNHGFYQALAQTAIAQRFIAEPILKLQAFSSQARSRLKEMIQQQYFAEGIHREHSPGYHLLTLQVLTNAARAGLINTPDIARMIDTAEEGLSWFYMPNGNIVSIGDTDPWGLRPEDEPWKWFSNRRLINQLKGECHLADSQAEMRAFKESGYFCVQSRPSARSQEKPSGTTLVQIAGFHSLTHKHADHLSCVWWDRGQEILIDPGRFGYGGRMAQGTELHRLGFQYGAPERQFVESSRAHNVVEVDGREFDRRHGQKFGSALKAHGLSKGMNWSLASYEPFQNVIHTRFLGLRPDHSLLIIDFLRSANGELHDYRQWFHLGADLHAIKDKRGLRVSFPQGDLLRVFPLIPDQAVSEIVCGQTIPHMQGWYCPAAQELAPAPAFAMDHPVAADACLATLFVFDRAVTLVRNALEPKTSSGELEWLEGDQRCHLSIRRTFMKGYTVQFVSDVR